MAKKMLEPTDADNTWGLRFKHLQETGEDIQDKGSRELAMQQRTAEAKQRPPSALSRLATLPALRGQTLALLKQGARLRALGSVGG